VPPGAAALQFSMRDPRVTSTVCGVSKPERVAETLTWANWTIPEAVWTELAEIPYSTSNPQTE
jgi:D-threo-aldose 1-dehydrogenase